MTRMRWRNVEPATAGLVTPVELFFDSPIPAGRSSGDPRPLWPEASLCSFWVLVLATIPIGAMVSAGIHLASVVTVLAAMLVIDSRRVALAERDLR